MNVIILDIATVMNAFGTRDLLELGDLDDKVGADVMSDKRIQETDGAGKSLQAREFHDGWSTNTQGM